MVVVPTGKMLPAGAPVRTTEAEQLSEAEAVPSVASSITRPQEEAVGPVLRLTAGGALSVGFCVSVTVTVKLQAGPAELVQVTVVSPTGKKVLEGWSHVTVPQAAPEVVV